MTTDSRDPDLVVTAAQRRCSYCECVATHVVHTVAGRTVETCDACLRKAVWNQLVAPSVYRLGNPPVRLTVDVEFSIKEEDE